MHDIRAAEADAAVEDLRSPASTVAAFDWSDTSLGPLESWPQSLRTATDLCLASRFPMSILWDEELAHIYNRAFSALSAASGADAMGASMQNRWSDLWHISESDYRRVVQQGETIYRENEHLSRSQTDSSDVIRATVCYSPLWDRTGRIRGVHTTMTDTTRYLADRRRIQELTDEVQTCRLEVERAHRAKNVFLANMSHEIRTPLTAMLGFATLLARRLEGRALTYARRIEQGGQRLTETLSAVLMLAKLESDRLEVNREVISPSEEVRGLMDLYAKQAEEKGLAYTCEVAPGAESARVFVDRDAFASVMQNLLANAIKFTQSGHVRVRIAYPEHADGPHRAAADEGPRRVLVQVQDSGVGIDASYLPHLFEPFSQESSGTQRAHGGSGLGLSVAKKLVEKMSGSMEVESSKGSGSSFTVALPGASPEMSSETVYLAAAESRAVDQRRVLLVEDNLDTQVLVRDLLEQNSSVAVTSTAEEAVQAAEEAAAGDCPFDVVLVDINLGRGPDGTEVLQRLRPHLAYHAAPFVAMTAFAMPGDREHLLEEGFDAYLGKPFTVDELVELLDRISPVG